MKKKTLLVVDDSNLVMARLLPLLQEHENIEYVIHAASYGEAMEILTDIKADLILLDINLPGRSGIELLRSIKEKDQTARISMFTNQASDAYFDLCTKLGAIHFFDKSKDFDRIAGIISADT